MNTKTRTIEIADTLQARIESAIDDVKDELMRFLESNPDTDTTPDIDNNLNYSGAIHEIIALSVPIYTKEIRDTMYLHGPEIEQAFEDAGIGGKDGKWPMGWEAAAIYCYIEQHVHSWYHDNAAAILDEWKAKQTISAGP